MKIPKFEVPEELEDILTKKNLLLLGIFVFGIMTFGVAFNAYIEPHKAHEHISKVILYGIGAGGCFLLWQGIEE